MKKYLLYLMLTWIWGISFVSICFTSNPLYSRIFFILTFFLVYIGTTIVLEITEESYPHELPFFPEKEYPNEHIYAFILYFILVPAIVLAFYKHVVIATDSLDKKFSIQVGYYFICTLLSIGLPFWLSRNAYRETQYKEEVSVSN